jgi:hypothetical protein
LFRRSLILPQGLVFKPLAGLETKIKRSKKQTSTSLFKLLRITKLINSAIYPQTRSLFVFLSFSEKIQTES